ncbi:hypothetical protein JCM33374_g6077 [Metschnikowia sp. JCM 33374]|nr:hypothetical protein JCM33374_g6077 [Metschnikowia sp. JCM 33374]
MMKVPASQPVIRAIIHLLLISESAAVAIAHVRPIRTGMEDTKEDSLVLKHSTSPENGQVVLVDPSSPQNDIDSIPLTRPEKLFKRAQPDTPTFEDTRFQFNSAPIETPPNWSSDSEAQEKHHHKEYQKDEFPQENHEKGQKDIKFYNPQEKADQEATPKHPNTKDTPDEIRKARNSFWANFNKENKVLGIMWDEIFKMEEGLFDAPSVAFDKEPKRPEQSSEDLHSESIKTEAEVHHHQHYEPNTSEYEEIPDSDFFYREPQSNQFYNERNTYQDPEISNSRIIFMDIASSRQQVGDSNNEREQTAMFSARSQVDGSAAVGVADNLAEAKSKLSYFSLLPHAMCQVAKSTFPLSQSQMHASKLLDKAYREVLGHQEKVSGYPEAVFGIISRRGKATVSAVGDAGAMLYRSGKLIESTEPKDHPNGEPYVLRMDTKHHMSASQELKSTFDMFTEKQEYEWEIHSGDYLLFYSGDFKRFTKPDDFPKLVRLTLDASANELAEMFLDTVAERVRRNIRIVDQNLLSCFPCFSTSLREFPTDLSLVVVKIL